MSPEKFALGVALAVFAGGALGLILRRILPEKHTTGGAKDMVGAVVGLLTLLSALVGALLIWTAYGVYAGQNIAIQTLAAKDLQLDLALADYGPEANPLRAQIRDSVGKIIDQVWGANDSDANFVANNFAAAIQSLRSRDSALESLHPTTDVQAQALATAKATVDAIGQSRFQMSFALSAPVSYPLVLIVVSWAVFLFCGYGLTSGPGNVVPVIAVAVGAMAVASAIWLILDLSSPYSGVFRASSAPLEQVLAVMGKE
jgi:hypothetical protein